MLFADQIAGDGVAFSGDGFFAWLLGPLSWGIFRSPMAFIAFFIFFCAGLAETKRAPFDLPEAESELVSGFHTEYSGIRFSFFFLAEYAAMYVICLVAAILFLGGWHWPLPVARIDADVIGSIATHLEAYRGRPGSNLFEFYVFYGPLGTLEGLLDHWKFFMFEGFGFVNLIGKSFVLLFVMLWLRWTLPRVRIDQVMHMCLKVLLPIGLALLLLAAVQAAITRPAPPIVEWPSRGAVVPPDGFWFRWSVIPQQKRKVEGYQLVVYDADDPATPIVINTQTDEPYFTPGAPLTAGRRYFYVVYPIVGKRLNPSTGELAPVNGRETKPIYFTMGEPGA